MWRSMLTCAVGYVGAAAAAPHADCIRTGNCKLTCGSSSGIAFFRAFLDPGSFVIGSGYFTMTQASITDNFNEGRTLARLTAD